MKWVFFAFLGLYLISLLLLLIGTFGWLGQEQDPLSGVFLLPLGLPWNVIADRVGIAGVASLLITPAINLGILFWFWKR